MTPEIEKEVDISEAYAQGWNEGQQALAQAKDAECFYKDKGVIEMIEEAKNEIIEKGWEYIVKATREGSWSKKEYIEALQDKE